MVASFIVFLQESTLICHVVAIEKLHSLAYELFLLNHSRFEVFARLSVIMKLREGR